MKVPGILFLVLLSLNGFTQNIINWVEPDTVFDELGRACYIIELQSDFKAVSYKYSNDGILQQETYETRKNNTQYEIVTEYHQNGNKKSISHWYILDKRFYGKPSLDSIYSEYDKQGVLIETIEYADNKLNGNNYTYYANGSVQSLTRYVNNKRHGPKMTYFKNGKIASESEYIEGRLNTVTYYNEEGTAFKNSEFSNGEGKLYFYEFGELKGYCLFKRGKTRKCNCDCD